MWAGQRNVLVGDLVAGIGWDDETTAAALARACAEWPLADTSGHVPGSLGVRSVAVGLLRRRIWLVHHGTPLRHRAEDLTAAAAFVRDALRRLALPPADGELSLPCRAFAKGGDAVVVRVPDDVDVDERPLRRRGIEQLPALSTVVRPRSSTVVQPDRAYALTGAVIDPRFLGDATSLNDARRHLLSVAVDERQAWAWAIDRLGDRIMVTSSVGAALRKLLG